MASNRLFFIFAACVGLLAYAALSAAQDSSDDIGFVQAAEQAAKDLLSFPLNGIKIRLYKKDCSYKEFSATSADVIVPFLNSTQKTFIHLHGYSQSTDNPYVHNLLCGLAKNYPYNVLAVDYRYCTYQFYPSSVLLAGSVGGVVLNAVETLEKSGVEALKIILCGFSLGAQIVGYIGRHLHFDVSEIIGLDPAGPMFNIMEPSISETDGQCVKCVHTDENMFGTSRSCGHLDFYPNGGYRNQPGCNLVSSLGACSHEMATELTAEAAANPNGFLAIKCDSWEDFKEGNCDKSAIIPFGANAPCNATGKYYLQTNPQQPYARGMAGTTYNSSLVTPFWG